jgi:hypothetical protein
MSGVRTFGFWLRLGPTVEVQGAAQCANAEAAGAFEKALHSAVERGSDYLHVLGTSPEADKVAEELAKNCKITRNEDSVTMQATAKEETVRKVAGP